MKIFCFEVLVLCLLLTSVNEAFSQGKDSVNAEFILSQHRKVVRKAMICSAVLPGLGQIYNKKYWKVPILFGGIGALVYFIKDNNKTYIYYRDLYSTIDLPGPSYYYDERFKDYNKEQLKVTVQRYQDNFRRYRDLCAIGFALVYVANIIDATVDAHFKFYDINQDLTINIEPAVLNNIYGNSLNNNTLGMKIVFNF